MQNELSEIEKRLQTYEPSRETYPDDDLALMTCEEAFTAVTEGNYGVGSIIVSASGDVLFRGHNQVFHPYFRSDLHAEMVVMNAFEDHYRDISDMKGYRLYCSIEPCPMCIARVIAAGVGTVKYVAPDSGGGMVQTMMHLPQSWINLSKRQSFSQAQASPFVKQLALDIFMSNLLEMREKLFSR
jgi:cytosine deaminase